MKEKTIYDLPDMALESYKVRLLEYIKSLSLEHRAIRDALIKEGKSYRSHRVAFQSGCLIALLDMVEFIEAPRKAKELKEAIKELAKRF